MNRNLKITIIGQGYVGMPISLLLAKKNYIVDCYDINKNLIKKLSSGKYGKNFENETEVIDFYRSIYKKKNINFTNQLTKSDIYVICVPTPIKNNKRPDLSYVNSAVKKIIPLLKDNDLIIIESTIAIGSINKIYNLINSKNKNINFFLAYCPERVLPGNALNEIKKNDRIIGGINNKSSRLARNFYKIFVKGKIHLTSVGIAEFTKLSENAFRDVNIAYANELSILCEKHKVNFEEVIELANKHPRVNILEPGIGVGGHCIPIDPWFLVENYKNKNSVIRNSRLVNKNKTNYLANKIIKFINHSNKNLKKPVIFLGLSYKANIGDIRESPAIEIINKVSKKINKSILINDPYVKKNVFEYNKKINMVELKDGISKSSDVIILVGHNKYKNIKRLVNKHQSIFDICNILKKNSN